MNYDEAMNYIEAVSCSGIMPGLVRIQALLERTGNPEKKCNVIHVAGTNGKGSVCTYIASVLMKAGYRVGRYVSPTLFDYRERIQINGQWISKEDLVHWMDIVRQANAQMQIDGIEGASAFEIETVVAFLYFQNSGCDFVVLETGMGGRLDATNVVTKPVLSVITSIGMDHMRFLGNTIEAISTEKGGIIKEGRPVIIGTGRKEATEVLKHICRVKKSDDAVVDREAVHICQASLYEGQRFDFEHYRALQTKMPGCCQSWNAAIAIRAIERMCQMTPEEFPVPIAKLPGKCVDETIIRVGIEAAYWPGRFEVIEKEPPLIIDGAHNPDGVQSLIDSMRTYLAEWPMILVMGVFADKDYQQMLQMVSGYAETLIAFKPDNPRGLDAKKLADSAIPYFKNSIAAADQKEALEIAKALSQGQKAIVCFGSLSTMAKWYHLTGRKFSDAAY